MVYFTVNVKRNFISNWTRAEAQIISRLAGFGIDFTIGFLAGEFEARKASGKHMD